MKCKKTPSQGVQSSQPWLGDGWVIPLRGCEKQSWGWPGPHPSRPGLPLPSNIAIVGTTHHHTSLLPPHALSTIKPLLGGGAPMGNTSPGIPPSQMPPQVAPPIKIHQYISFALYNHYFIGPFKKCDCKKVQNRIQKNTILCGTSTMVNLYIKVKDGHFALLMIGPGPLLIILALSAIPIG